MTMRILRHAPRAMAFAAVLMLGGCYAYTAPAPYPAYGPGYAYGYPAYYGYPPYAGTDIVVGGWGYGGHGHGGWHGGWHGGPANPGTWHH
jgi:hypothetical protein